MARIKAYALANGNDCYCWIVIDEHLRIKIVANEGRHERSSEPAKGPHPATYSCEANDLEQARTYLRNVAGGVIPNAIRGRFDGVLASSIEHRVKEAASTILKHEFLREC